jgi:POT family proton-dependent oligopeptide transporter
MNHENNSESPTLFGHPAGLFTLFFAEMWERFSYYGMRALLVFYMIKGFLRYGDGDAYAVYGAYTALVYMTPFFGGMLADRLLGARRAVVLGGLLMAAGHLMMMIETQAAFFAALALLICGNGFFKPSISTIVGGLYPAASSKRDGGFTIFYMGINLGAAMSPLLCGYIGETYGWHYGFGLATLGMLTGLAVFVNWLPPTGVGAPPDRDQLKRRPVAVTQALILLGAATAALGLILFRPDNPFSISVNAFVALCLMAAGIVACVALRGGVGGLINLEWATYMGALLSVPVFALLVSGFAPLRADQRGVHVVPQWVIDNLEPNGILAMVLTEVSRPAGLVLMLAGLLAMVYLGIQTFRLDRIPRQRMYVVLILTFFSMLFWAFFEQAGSSLNNFTDRNVDRVLEERTVTAADIGQTLRIQPTQEQLGYANGERMFTLDELDRLREQHGGEPGFRDRLAGQREQRGDGDCAPHPRAAGQHVPSRQSDLHHGVRVGVHRPVDDTGPDRLGAQHARQVRFWLIATGAGLRRVLVRRPAGRHARHGGLVGAVRRLPVAHQRRTVPVPRRPVDGHAAVAGEPGQHRDGRLVPGDGVLAIPGRDHRPIHGRRFQRKQRGRGDPDSARDGSRVRRRIR